MSRFYTIPQEFKYPEQIEATIEDYNQLETAELVSDVEVRSHENGTRMILAAPEAYANFQEAVEDTSMVITFDYPFANGDFPWKRIQALFIADITGHPVVGIASPGTDGSKYTFSTSEREKISNGDMSPYVRKGSQAIADYTEVPRIASIGASQGANMAARRGVETSDLFDTTEYAAVFDHTGAEARSRIRLFGDLSKAGYDKLEEELEKGEIIALLESIGFRGEKENSELRKILHYFRSMSRDPRTGLLISKGLGRLTLADDMVRLSKAGVRSVFGYGGDSAIADETRMDEERHRADMQLITSGTRLGPQVVRFEGTTHAGADNMKRFGLLVLVAAGATRLTPKA